MENAQIIGWSFQACIGLLLLAITAYLNTMRSEFGKVKDAYATLQTQVAALTARVSSEREDTLRSLNRIELSLGAINRKLDRLSVTKPICDSDEE